MTPKTGRNRAQRLFPAESCETCGSSDSLERHHVNEDPTDNRPENVMILCRRHHFIIHNQARDPRGRFLSKSGTLQAPPRPMHYPPPFA